MINQKLRRVGAGSMIVDWSIVIGFAGILIAVIGAVIARDRALTNMIHSNHETAVKESSDGDDRLHERINRTRDEMHNQFVRRVDLDGHLLRIENQVSDLRQDMKDERRETNQRLDAVLAAIREGK